MKVNWENSVKIFMILLVNFGFVNFKSHIQFQKGEFLPHLMKQISNTIKIATKILQKKIRSFNYMLLNRIVTR